MPNELYNKYRYLKIHIILNRYFCIQGFFSCVDINGNNIFICVLSLPLWQEIYWSLILETWGYQSEHHMCFCSRMSFLR